uniref:chloroplast envelope membrane protein n=1 Tax=Cuscuta corymbosa var. stylosa TaxID=437254 RepID=UPI0024351CBC|nr:chloroplast envelope membrane protein [Cuscuta corymbosa var. stylosa]WEY29954.1 chloroplast envelope membrane protein [Cuscuta corymbosa var. stylosa]
MTKNKIFTHLSFLVFLPWWIYLALNQCMRSWLTNWWNAGQSELFLNMTQENSILEKFVELEDFIILDEIIQNDFPTDPQRFNTRIYEEALQLINIQNENDIQMIFHLLTNIVCFIILNGFAIWRNENPLSILNSWSQKLLFNLSDTVKVFFLLLFMDLFFGYHSTRAWEFTIGFLYHSFGFGHNAQIISVLACIIPVSLDISLKYCLFLHLNRVSPSLLILYNSMGEVI